MVDLEQFADKIGEEGRDLRVDACRGIALWFIFLNHVPNNVGSWLTLSHYGFSDTTELFMFVSGLTCALAYGQVQRQDGWSSVVAHTLRRSWEIYIAFLILTIACAVMAYLLSDGRFADETNTRILLEHPGPSLLRAAILQYRPVNTDVLPTFVLFHLFFAPLLLLFAEDAKRDARCVVWVVHSCSAFRMEPASMAEKSVVLQSARLAAPDRARC